MQISSAEYGKFRAIVQHHSDLEETFNTLFSILDKEDFRREKLSKLSKHVSYFKDRFEREEAEKAAKKQQEARDLEVGTIRVMTALQTFFPKAFPVEAEKVKPLYVGIDSQIYAALSTVNKIEGLEVTYAMVGEALRRWVTMEAYYLSFKTNKLRINIYGDPIEYILPRDFNHANKKYVELTGGQKTTRKTIEDLPASTAPTLGDILAACLAP
ncbi:putative ProP effector protein [Rhizobium phage RL38J1]|uniref:Putative ProP effector protein n=1 Tax=Rhizobium phage RL38J1 TaxID=2663232 RepID=A0A6B9J2U8_9CAUD|nr:putative ProP effector protein [Rhizobium phage RL38J1]QGZ13893.1 putative ProP effector protein [Rhizobium phage RL38J1]